MKVRVRLPKARLSAEVALTAKQLQDLAHSVAQIKWVAPELEFAFRLIVTAEGERPSEAVLTELNKLLNDVKSGWKME